MVTQVCLNRQEILGTTGPAHKHSLYFSLFQEDSHVFTCRHNYESLHNHQEMHQSLATSKVYFVQAILKLFIRAAVTKA